MTVAACVSTEMWRDLVRPSVVSASFVLVVIHESFIMWPSLGFATSSAFAVFLTSGLGDWARSTVGGSIRAIVARIRSARLMALVLRLRALLWMAQRKLSMGDAMSAGGQERRKITSLTGSPAGQTGKIVRGGQSSSGARSAASHVRIGRVARLEVGPGLDAALGELAQELPARGLENLVGQEGVPRHPKPEGVVLREGQRPGQLALHDRERAHHRGARLLDLVYRM